MEECESPGHAGDGVEGGGSRQEADTEHFYFFCPRCPRESMLQVTNYKVLQEEKLEGDCLEPADLSRFLTVQFELHCQRCGFHDVMKVSNMGWQGGNFADAIRS